MTSLRSRPVPFVGRHHEIELLQAQLADAGTGAGSVVLLAGEPGIGKTRTAEELAAIAQDQATRVLWGRCYEGEGAPAFWPWVQVIDSYVRALPADRLRLELGAGGPDIAEVVPEVRERLPDLPPPPPLEPAQARFRLFESVSRLLRNAAGAGGSAAGTPLLVILDDLHWADVPSLLLQFLARDVPGMRLLVLGTYRNVEVGRGHPLTGVLAELARQPHVVRVPLEGMTEPDVRRLAMLIAGMPLSDGLVAALSRETEGNPFFVSEAVRMLASEGRLHRTGTAGEATLTGVVPQRVREVVTRRLDRLSPSCNRVLTIAAVIGRAFSVAALGRVSELAGDPLLEVLEEAETGRVITPLRAGVGRYRFTHALIRECLYEDLPSTRRARLHRQVAEALESLYTANPEPHLDQLAHHFFQAAPAGDVEKAVAYQRQAAERATALLAHEEAIAHYERAIAVLELKQSADPGLCCALLLDLGDAQNQAGDREGAQATLQRAADMAHRIGAAAELARAALAYGGTALTAGVADTTLITLLTQARNALGGGDSGLAARVTARLAMEHYYSEARERGEALSQESVAMARRLADPATVAYTLMARRILLWTPERARERLALAAEILNLAREAADKDLAIQGHHARIVDLLDLGKIDEVDAALVAHARLAQELRHPHYLWHAVMWQAMRALLDGRLAEAGGLVLQSRDAGARAGGVNVMQVFGAQMLTLVRLQGQPQALAPAVAAFVAQHPTIPAWRCALAVIHAELEQLEEARQEFEILAARGFADLPLDGQWLICVTLLAEVCAFLDDARRAARLYDMLLPYADLTATLGNAVVCTGSVARYLGLLAATTHRWQEAAAHFEAALSRHARMGARPYTALTQHEYARTLLAAHAAQCRGRRAACDHQARARALLDPALRAAHELGMARLVTQVERLQRSVEEPQPEDREARTAAGAGIGSPAGITCASLPDGLTPREAEVLGLIAAGKTNREIAEMLVVTLHTVERHITHLYGKIGARGRADATAYAIRHNLTASPTP